MVSTLLLLRYRSLLKGRPPDEFGRILFLPGAWYASILEDCAYWTVITWAIVSLSA